MNIPQTPFFLHKLPDYICNVTFLETNDLSFYAQVTKNYGIILQCATWRPPSPQSGYFWNDIHKLIPGERVRCSNEHPTLLTCLPISFIWIFCNNFRYFLFSIGHFFPMFQYDFNFYSQVFSLTFWPFFQKLVVPDN